MTTIATAGVPATFTSTRGRTAREMLAGRALTVINCDAAFALASFLESDVDGLVLTGEARNATMRQLRNAYPDMVVMVESSSHKDHFASVDEPFYLPGDEHSLFGVPTLQNVVDDQRTAKAAIVVLPAGYIRAGDPRALRAVIEGANAIAGDDILVPLYLDKAWLAEQYICKLLAAVDESKHPLAFAFGASKNPLDSASKLELHARLLAHGGGSVSWRTDYAGLAAFALGALAAAIGAIPSQRRVTAPDSKGRAHRPDDATPYTLIPGLMHYMKTGAMKHERYVSSDAPSCTCLECEGANISRFTASVADARACERHNLEMTRADLRDLLAVAPAARPGVWQHKAQDALLAHEATAAATGMPFSAGEQVEMWAAGLQVVDAAADRAAEPLAHG